MWNQYGGSGINMNWFDTLDLSFDEAEWLVERIEKQRREEYQKLKGSSVSM